MKILSCYNSSRSKEGATSSDPSQFNLNRRLNMTFPQFTKPFPKKPTTPKFRTPRCSFVINATTQPASTQITYFLARLRTILKTHRGKGEIDAGVLAERMSAACGLYRRNVKSNYGRTTQPAHSLLTNSVRNTDRPRRPYGAHWSQPNTTTEKEPTAPLRARKRNKWAKDFIARSVRSRLEKMLRGRGVSSG